MTDPKEKAPEEVPEAPPEEQPQDQEGEPPEEEGIRQVLVSVWPDGRWQVQRTNCWPTDLFMMAGILDFFARMQMTQSWAAQAKAEAQRQEAMRRIVVPGGGPPQ